jgi:hypothetical protein
VATLLEGLDGAAVAAHVRFLCAMLGAAVNQQQVCSYLLSAR